jgi:hypothetical protein
MHDEHSTPHSTEHAEKLGYEDSDVSIPVLMKWGFFLAVFVGVTSVVVLGLYAVFVPQLMKLVRPAKPDTQVTRRLPPAGVPQVQADPVKDIQDFRRLEAARLTQYGFWKDGDNRNVQYIPLERAMQIVEAKGLPIQSAESARNDVTPPAVDRGYVNDPLPDGTQPGVPGKVGVENGDTMDDSTYSRHTPGM